jgi:low temperature requirement protein LtrA
LQALARLIQPPRLWPSDPHKERRATWMELFFDLIFVAAVAQVGKSLAADYSWAGLLRYSFLFVLIWLAWSGHTLFATRFDTDDLIQRLLILAQSFVAAVMAANSKDALDSVDAAGFGAAYAGMRVVLVLQYLRARRVPATRQLTTRYAIGYAAAAVAWIASALTPVPARYWVWSVALAMDLSAPGLAARHSAKHPPDAAHFPERFGLFTIILLGEFVAAVMHGIEKQETWSVAAFSTAWMSMAFAFVVWWWYFDGAQGPAERHIRTRRQAIGFRIWNYAHLPLFLGIGVAGVGFEHTIALQGEERLQAAQSWILCVAVATLMAALIAVGATSEKAQKRGGMLRQILLQGSILTAVILLGIFSDYLHPAALVFGLILGCVGQTILAG